MIQRAIHASEHEEQATLIQAWSYQHRSYGLPEFALFAIPNSGAGSQRGQAGKLKAEGVRPGVPDLCLAVPRGTFHGLYLEMKAHNGRPTPEQLALQAYLQSAGYQAEVCHGAEAAIAAICNYLRQQ